MEFKSSLTRVTTVTCTQYLYMWNVKRQPLNYCNIETYLKFEMVVSIFTRYFLVYIFVDCYEVESCLQLRQFFPRLMESFHVLNNVQLDDT